MHYFSFVFTVMQEGQTDYVEASTYDYDRNSALNSAEYQVQAQYPYALVNWAYDNGHS